MARVLEASHQLVLLEPWYGNATVSLVKRPKLYLREAGLAAFLCGVHGVDDLRSSPLVGALWETLVCAEIRRAQGNRHGRWNLHFWHDRTREADFVVHRAGRFHITDAKWTQQPRHRDAAALRKILNVLPNAAVDSLSVVCGTPNAYPLADDVEAVPLDGMRGALLGD